MSSEPKVDDIVKELVEIKRRSGPRLSKRGVPRVRDLFVLLRRKWGYSAKDIEQMTGGVWKEPAIKP